MQTFPNEYVDEWAPLAAGVALTIVPAAAVFSLVQRPLVSGPTAAAAKS